MTKIHPRAVPVKYMVVPYTTICINASEHAEVIDTSLEGQGRVVAVCHDVADAHAVAAALNYVEGYEHYSPVVQ